MLKVFPFSILHFKKPSKITVTCYGILRKFSVLSNKRKKNTQLDFICWNFINDSILVTLK